MTDRELMQQALEALERAVDALQDEKRYVRAAGASRAITALRAALAEQPAEPQDPVAYNGWALREVYFDEEGNPTMHREPTKAEPQEPVAWCHLRYNEDGTYFADCVQHYPDSYGNTPLYTAPQPAKPAEQEPVYLNPDIEYMAEEAECVAMCLNDRSVPNNDGDKSLSLWGRVEQYANPRFLEGMTTNGPEISHDHIVALARIAGLLGAYTTAEFVERVVGFARVLLNNKAVQEQFIIANSHLLYTAPQPAKPAEQERDGAMNAICKMFHHGEEVESDDGMAMLVPLDLWHDAIDALDSLTGEDEAAPEAPQPARREPLTEAQICSTLATAFPDDAGPDGSWQLAQYELDIFRLAERAHGIGEQE